MSGSVSGGKKAAITNKLRHGDNFYVEMGRRGGEKSRGGGFASSRELAVRAGRLGGKASRRGAIQKVETEARDTERQHRSWKERIGL